MIHLRRDCLVFRTSDGQNIPCSAVEVTAELLGDAAGQLGETFLQNAAEALLHYFQNELGRTTVSVSEFSQALEKVLRGFGFEVRSVEIDPNQEGPPVVEVDLRRLATESGKGFELLFFPRLRAELRGQLGGAPRVVRCRGLRGCVKELVGARRWSRRCQHLHDQIVEYLRICLQEEKTAAGCALVVQ